MNRFTKGLDQSTHPQAQPEGTYRDALNLSLTREPGALTQEEGTLEVLSLPADYRIVGKTIFPDGTVLLFMNNGAGGSKIYLFEQGVMESLVLVLEDGAQTLDLGNTVEAVATINQREERVVYWVDEVNPPRRMNIDLLTTTTYDSGLDIGLFYTFPRVPTVDLTINASGGMLNCGVYRVAVALVDNEGGSTPYLTLSAGIDVFPGAYLDPRSTTGGGSEVPTSRSIRVEVKELFFLQEFRGIKLALVRGTEVKVLPEIPLSSPTTVYTITGTESYSEGSLEEIIIPSASYDSAKAIAEDGGVIYLGNLTNAEEIDYQKYANNIFLEPVAQEYFPIATLLEERAGNTKIFGNGNLDQRYGPHFFNLKGYRRGETYAFYISLILKNGTESPAYHIPGRPPDPGEKDPYTEDGIDFGYWFRAKSNSGSNNMAYWENSNELYPDTQDFEIWDVDGDGNGFHTGDSLRGLPVRHHHFPNNAWVPFYDPSPGGGADPFSGSPMGFRLHNIKFPNEIKERIIGYRIYYALRGYENQKILDQAPVHQCVLGVGEWGGNLFPTGRSTADPDDWGSGQDNAYKVTFPFSFMRESRAPQDIQYIQKVGSLHAHSGDYNEDFGTGRYRSGLDPYTLDIGAHHVFKVAWAGRVNHNTENVAVGSDDPQVFMNRLSPDTIVLEIPSWTSGYDDDLVNLCRLLFSQYAPFWGQQLVWTGYQSFELDNPSTFLPIYGGDTFLTFYGYTVCEPDDDDTGSGPYSYRHLAQCVVESSDLISLRHEGELIYETFYPKTEPTVENVVVYGEEEDWDGEYVNGPATGQNYIRYNEDYSSFNNLKVAFAWNPYNRVDNNYPTRVARSSGASLRTFLLDDYKDLTHKRGPIIKLVSTQETLLIHMERSLFRTRGREELVTGDIRAFIGAGDIFSVDPQEIYTTEEGFGGLQDAHSALLTPYGYFFVDQRACEVYRLSDGLEGLNGGLDLYLKNALLGGTQRIGYDPFQKKIYLAGLVGVDPWMLSYLPNEKVWESFHSGNAEFFFSDTKTLYIQAQDGKLYKRHPSANEGDYMDETGQLFRFTFVSRNDPPSDEVVSALYFTALFDDYFGVNLPEETLDDYRITNEVQDTGTVPIIRFENARRTQHIWKVNRIRDSAIPDTAGGTLPVWRRRRMIGTYHVVTLRYNPVGNHQIHLFDADLLRRPSIR